MNEYGQFKNKKKGESIYLFERRVCFFFRSFFLHFCLDLIKLSSCKQTKKE